MMSKVRVLLLLCLLGCARSAPITEELDQGLLEDGKLLLTECISTHGKLLFVASECVSIHDLDVN